MAKITQYYTYIYRDPSRNNDPIYVGKGKGKRSHSHLKRCDKHPFVQRLQFMKKNNISPTIEIINAIDEAHALFMEECCISVIGRKDLGKGSLLNQTDGGENNANLNLLTKEKLAEWARYYHTGRKHTPQARANMAAGRALQDPMSQETKDKIREKRKMQVITEESNKKRSIALKGKPKSEEHRKNVSIALKGKIGSMQGKQHSQETKSKISESIKEWHANRKNNKINLP